MHDLCTRYAYTYLHKSPIAITSTKSERSTFQETMLLQCLGIAHCSKEAAGVVAKAYAILIDMVMTAFFLPDSG